MKLSLFYALVLTFTLPNAIAEAHNETQMQEILLESCLVLPPSEITAEDIVFRPGAHAQNEIEYDLARKADEADYTSVLDYLTYRYMDGNWEGEHVFGFWADVKMEANYQLLYEVRSRYLVILTPPYGAPIEREVVRVESRGQDFAAHRNVLTFVGHYESPYFKARKPIPELAQEILARAHAFQETVHLELTQKVARFVRSQSVRQCK